MSKIDLTNKIYGKLTVLKDSGERTKCKSVIWTCKCECGNFHNIGSSELIRGNTTSCGCLKLTSYTLQKIDDNNSKCLKCNSIKSNSEFYYRRNRIQGPCKNCQNNESKINRKNTKIPKIKHDSKEYSKKYHKKYRNKINKHARDRYFKNPVIRLRRIISTSICRALKAKAQSKNGKSCLNYILYTIDDLKIHLSNLFEPWMTWNNHGKYDINTWNDSDSSTWKWQLDHIIPQSEFSYFSMSDDTFKKCWSLDNLRPLSAKQNILDGVNKIRHGDK